MSINMYKSGMDKLTEFKFCENVQRLQQNVWHMFKVIRSNIEIATTPPDIA